MTLLLCRPLPACSIFGSLASEPAGQIQKDCPTKSTELFALNRPCSWHEFVRGDKSYGALLLASFSLCKKKKASRASSIWRWVKKKFPKQLFGKRKNRPKSVVPSGFLSNPYYTYLNQVHQASTGFPCGELSMVESLEQDIGDSGA